MSNELVPIEVLNNFYDINVNLNRVICINDSYYFYYNNELFLLKSISRRQYQFLFDNHFLNVVNNVHNSFITIFKGKLYVLFKKSKMNFDNIMYFNINNSFPYKSTCYYDLRNKFNLFEKYIYHTNKKNKIIPYFMSLAAIVLNYIKMTNNKYVQCGLINNSDANYSYLLKSYFLCNYHYGPIVLSLVNLIKYYYFEKGKLIIVDVFKLYSFNKNDFMIFYAALLYPTYIFNLFNKKISDYEYERVINMVPRYFLFVNNIYLYIKKRYTDIPYIKT